MRGSNVLEREGFAICVQLVTGGEGLLRQGLRGRGVEMQAGERTVCSSIQDGQIMRLRTCASSCFRGQGPWRLRREEVRCYLYGRSASGLSMTYFTGALPRPARASLSLGHAGATKVSTTNLPSGPLRTTTLPPGPEKHSEIVSKLSRLDGSGV